MMLQAKKSDFIPHPEGIHAAVCVDVIDLGPQQVEWQGQVRTVQKVRIVFESEARTPEGTRMTIGRSFTASLHQKAKLAEFLGKWRGKPVVPGDTIDTDKLIGAACTLVISHQQSTTSGETYACIDAISKPTRKVLPSGTYDPVAARERIKQNVTARGGKLQAPPPTAAASTPEPVDPEVGF